MHSDQIIEEPEFYFIVQKDINYIDFNLKLVL